MRIVHFFYSVLLFIAITSCSTTRVNNLRLPSSFESASQSSSCKEISTSFIKKGAVNKELANISGLKYLTQKFTEIKHLDRSNLIALLLRYKLVAQNEGKSIIDVPLSKLKAIHPIDRGASLEKTKARAATLSQFIRENGMPEVITTDIQEITIKSRMLMRAVETDDGNYIIFDGNGRLFALREFAENISVNDIPISIELYKIDYSKIKHLVEIRRKHLYSFGEDVSDARAELYKSHITDSELDEMITELISERKKYSGFQQFISTVENKKIMRKLSSELGVKIRQFENIKRWREYGYGPAYKEGISEKELELMVNKKVPLGFSEELFEEAKRDLLTSLKSEKIDSGHFIVDGSSTTFYSQNPNKKSGKHFSSKGMIKSDIDFKVYSKNMAKKMRDANYTWNGYEDFFKSRWMESEFKTLKDFNKKWSKILGRKVTVIGVDREIIESSQYGNFIVDLSNH